VADGFELVGIDGKLLEGQEALDNLGDSGLVELTPYDMKVVTAARARRSLRMMRLCARRRRRIRGRRRGISISVGVGEGRGWWKLKFHQATAAHWGDW